MSRSGSFRAALFASAAIFPTFVAVVLAQERVATPPSSDTDAVAPQAEQGGIVLDEITVVPTRTAEPVATTLAAVTQVGSQELELLQPTTPTDIFFGVPGVTSQADSRRTQASVNVRGLQDFGRVAVVVDGARNNFQRSDHGAQSVFWVEPEMLKEATVVRGPVANIYGSGAIGGVVAFETIDADDFLRGGERIAGSLTTRWESNGPAVTSSATAAARITDAFSLLGNLVYKEGDDYQDGDGGTVLGTGFEVLAGLAKTTVRPTENSRLRLGWVGHSDEWTERFGPGRDTELDQHTLTGRYDYASPENQWIDFHVNGYLNDVAQRQVQLGDETQFDEDTGLPEVIPAGTERSFDLRTTGFDVWNTSRFETSAFRHAVTIGGDWFRDEVETTDPIGGGDVYTPSGERQAYGAFAQDRIEYSDWLEVIGALRFDGYSLDGEVDGEDVNSDGERLSPRLTLGVSPFEQTALQGIQLYGTYAEGYRSPSVTETLITGLHPAGVVFPFLPNPDLKPETATTYEIGLNFAREGLFTEADGIRIKTAAFRNDVENYIGLDQVLPGAFGGDPDCPFLPPIPGVPAIPLCFQYVNVSEVQIDGFEFEGFYDAGRFFTGFTATVLDGKDRDTGDRLVTIPPAQLTGRIGFRFLGERLVIGGEVIHVVEEDEIDAPLAEDYTLANLFAFYEPNENVRFDLRLNNLFDEPYANYLNASSGAEVLEQGFNAKLGATIRFGAS